MFNWAFGTILLLAALQILLDLGTLLTALVRGRRASPPDTARYTIAGVAALLAAIGVSGALRVPPVKDVEIAVRGLPPQFEGYRLLSSPTFTSADCFPRAGHGRSSTGQTPRAST